MSLKKYVERQNLVNSLWNNTLRPMDIKALTDANKAYLAERLSMDLSPEALTCDGELRGAKLQAKINMLRKAVKELEAMGVAVEEY